MKSLLLFLTALSLAAVARAQQFDNAVYIPVSYYGWAICNGTPPGASCSFSFGAELGTSSSASLMNPPPGSRMYSPVVTGALIPGKDYTVTVTSAYCGVVFVNFQAIDGCDIYIQGVRATSYTTGANYTFTLRIEKINDLTQSLAGQRGGQCSSFPEDKPIWYIGMGALRNGRYAGAVGIRAPSITSDLFTTSALICDSVDWSEVSVNRTGGYITQIQSRDIVLQMDAYRQGGTSYSIRAFVPTNLSTPFITYTVSQYSVSGGTGIRVDKLEDGINWSTVLQQVGSVWTLYDWRVATAGQPIDTSNPVTTTVNGVTSTVNFASGSGAMVKQKNYVGVCDRTELASVVWGSGVTAPPTTTYAYYSSSSGSGWASAVQSIIQPTGNWTKYDYYNDATNSRAGKIWHVYRPWLNAPSDPSGAGTSSGRVETYDYAANYDGAFTVPMYRNIYVNGAPVAKTNWSYNWSYATVNSHTIAQIVQQDYSAAANYLTTTMLTYREDDANSFFWGKSHAVTRPDGTKDAYAYYFGTWNAGNYSFSPGSGNDRLALAFHGQAGAGSGTTQVTSWTVGSSSWTVDPIYLVANLSAVTETVVDTNGRVVFSAENIYTGSGIQRISATANTFNGNNLVTNQKDVIRSVSASGGDVSVTYSYSAGLCQSKTDIDGLQTAYHYDNYLRNDQITTASGATGSYPATTQYFTYFSSGLKQTGQESPRDPTITTYSYENSGRPVSASIPAPGTGTLTSSYSYPTNLQTKVTLPTNATKITYLYLDGRVSEQGGTGQVDTQYSYSVDSSYTYATTQLGSDQSHGWSETKSDWLGRPITLRTPQVGWSSGSSKVVRKTSSYSSSTGQLLSVSSTDEANGSARLLPDHLYVYGNLGMLVEEGDDLGNNGALDPVSNDRITYHSVDCFISGGGWVSENVTQVLRTGNNGSDLATVSDVTTRLTNFNGGAMLGSARELSEVVSLDASGRSSKAWEYSDQIAKTRTRCASIQGVSQNAQSVYQYGYLASDQSASGVTKTYAYDGSGRLLSVTEGTTSAEVTYAYFSGTAVQSSATQTTGPSETATTSYSYFWDTSRHTTIVASTDANGGIAYSESNALGLPWHTWGTAAQPSETGYDSYGRRTSITTWQTGTLWTGTTWPSSPPAGNVVTWTLDPVTGAATSKTFPNSSSIGSTYNARGQINTRTWARNVTTTYYYFETAGSQTGELKQVTYNPNTTPEVDYTYTRWGSLATVADASGSRTFNYNTDLTLNYEALDATFYNGRNLTATYDSPNVAPGRLTGYSFNGGVTVGLTLAYDAATGRTSTVTGAQGGANTTFSLAYAAGTDWVNRVTIGTSYIRDLPLVSRNDVISSATTTWSGTQLGNFTAKYTDLRGWRTGQDSGSASGTPTGSWSKVLGLGDGLNSSTYTLDGFGQLTNVPTPAWQATPGSQTLSARNFGWSYDLAGNRTAESGAAPTTYSTADTNPNAYGSLNQYESITGTLGESTLSYDADGNLTQDGTWTYAYDGENRLISMTRNDQTQALSFKYDYLGRRIRKTVTGSNASDTKFVWNGWQLVADLNADGYNVTRSYIWGPDFSDAHGAAGGAGSLLGIYNSGAALTYAMPDALGSIVGYINTSGNLMAAVEYSPFGRAINIAGSLGNYPIGFSGQYTDWESGLVYYGHRFYNPKHGRFINRDPIEEQGGLNLYAYCTNNAMNRWDVLGMYAGCGENGVWGDLNPALRGSSDPAVIARFAALDALQTQEQQNVWDLYSNGGIYGGSPYGLPTADQMMFGYDDGSMDQALLLQHMADFEQNYLAKHPEQRTSTPGATAKSYTGNDGNTYIVTNDTTGFNDSGLTLLPSNNHDPNNGSPAGSSPNGPGSLHSAVDGFLSGLLAPVGGLAIGVEGALQTTVGWAGYAWNSPNTAIGLAAGMIGWASGGSAPTIRNNAIMFANSPLASAGAITIGNAILVGPPTSAYPNWGPEFIMLNTYSVADHEQQHTYQGQASGPAYLPITGLSLLLGEIFNGDSHGPASFMETGPQSNPPRPWPW